MDRGTRASDDWTPGNLPRAVRSRRWSHASPLRWTTRVRNTCSNRARAPVGKLTPPPPVVCSSVTERLAGTPEKNVSNASTGFGFRSRSPSAWPPPEWKLTSQARRPEADKATCSHVGSGTMMRSGWNHLSRTRPQAPEESPSSSVVTMRPMSKSGGTGPCRRSQRQVARPECMSSVPLP